VIRIDGYLTQPKLEAALRAVVGDSAWRGSEIYVLERGKHRWDMAYQWQDQLVVVEFDGDEHYRHTLKIKTDRQKDEVARRSGHKVVRVPYWVQLTTETLQHFFGLHADIDQNFAHGFITTKLFPASFCEQGIARFEEELAALPTAVRVAVVHSLHDRASEHGWEYVLPRRLMAIVGQAIPRSTTR
jgi:hypothetical protein